MYIYLIIKSQLSNCSKFRFELFIFNILLIFFKIYYYFPTKNPQNSWYFNINRKANTWYFAGVFIYGHFGCILIVMFSSTTHSSQAISVNVSEWYYQNSFINVPKDQWLIKYDYNCRLITKYDYFLKSFWHKIVKISNL